MKTTIKTLLSTEMQDKVCVVMGTRPGMIKQSALVRALERNGVPFFIIHAGQHYSPELDRVFFGDLGIPEPLYRLETVKNFSTHAGQTAEMLKGIEDCLFTERPRAIVVGGDANCNLAGALAARKLNLVVCHEEAGVRGCNWNVPEGHNRTMIDHISDYLFAPNEAAAKNLEKESVQGKIRVTGSLIVDSVRENSLIACRKSTILKTLSLHPREYILITIHHEETVDYIEVLSNVIEALKLIAADTGRKIFFPIHPRTGKRLREFGLWEEAESIAGLHIIDPQGYFDFMTLLSNACLVMTDSGGVIQESSILHTPCVTISNYTEWLETLECGANVLGGTTADGIRLAAGKMLSSACNWKDPFGGGSASERITSIIKKEIL